MNTLTIEKLRESIPHVIEMARKDKRVSFFPIASYLDVPDFDSIESRIPGNAESTLRKVISPLVTHADNLYLYKYGWDEKALLLADPYWKRQKERLDNALVHSGRVVKFRRDVDLVDGFEFFWFRKAIPPGLFNGRLVFEFANAIPHLGSILEFVRGPAFVSGARSGFQGAIKRARSIADSGGTSAIWWGDSFEVYASADEIERITLDSFTHCFHPLIFPSRWPKLAAPGNKKDLNT